MREKLLTQLARTHAEHPWRMCIIILIITVLFGLASMELKVTMRWSDLLPETDPRTVEYNRIIEEFTSASNIVVVVQGPTDKIKAFADALAPQLICIRDTSLNQQAAKSILDLEKKKRNRSKKNPDDVKTAGLNAEIASLKTQIDFPLIQRVDYKIPMDFLHRHGLMLMKAGDLEDNQAMFTDPNIHGFIRNMNDVLEKEYVGRKESLSTREKEDQAIGFLDGIESLIALLNVTVKGSVQDTAAIRSTVNHLMVGEPYFLSYDKQALIMIAVPNFTAMEVDRMVSGTDAVQHRVDETLKAFPGVRAGLTGMIPIGRDEMVYGMESANVTSIIAVIAILILLIIAFRMWIAPLFAILNLIIGILWATGLTALIVGSLNIMTQMMTVILLGLGIDFSIHLISGFTEQRSAGRDIRISLERTFLIYGKGIVTGALTTAFAFLALLISHSRGMKEMGLVTGLGLIAVLLATFIVLPNFLVFRERRLERKHIRHAERDITFRVLGRSAAWMGRRHWFILSVSVILTAFMVWEARQITFDQNYMNMEPRGLTSVMLQDTITDKFDLSMDYALVLAGSADESRTLAKAYRKLGSVAMTEDIGLYIPSAGEQAARRRYIRHIRERILDSRIQANLGLSDAETIEHEIRRLGWNIMEIQDMAFQNGQDRVDTKCVSLVGNPDDEQPRNPILALADTLAAGPVRYLNTLNQFNRAFAPVLSNQIRTMANTEAISLDMLPESILERYANRDSSKFLVSVYPSASIWTNLEFLKRFVHDLSGVNDRATGMPTIFAALIEIIGNDGRKALMLTITVVFLLLCLDFRHIGHAFMAMIPLIAGTVWMVGLMHLTGLQFTVINVMGLPMIIGIGIDDGVHIVHRWVFEGKRDLYTIFASTGKAILLTTLTTMLAFGSLFFAVWRGFASLGSALFLGVGACFVTTVLFLSGLLGVLSKKSDKNPIKDYHMK
ncbi:MMPL family transporter [bacterium]|nr:MMPL family transporter [bacterium]